MSGNQNFRIKLPIEPTGKVNFPIWVVGTKDFGGYTYIHLQYEVFADSHRQKFYKPFKPFSKDDIWHKEMLKILLGESEKVFIAEVAYPEYYEYEEKLYEKYDSLESYVPKEVKTFKVPILGVEISRGDDDDNHAIIRRLLHSDTINKNYIRYGRNPDYLPDVLLFGDSKSVVAEMESSECLSLILGSISKTEPGLRPKIASIKRSNESIIAKKLSDSGLEAVVALDDYFFAFIKDKNRVLGKLGQFAGKYDMAINVGKVNSLYNSNPNIKKQKSKGKSDS